MSAAVVIMVQNRAIRALRSAGAFSVDTAVRLADVGIRLRWPVRALIRRGVLVRTPDDCYYLDEEAEQQLHRHRRNVFTLFIVLFAIFLLAICARWLTA